MFDINLLYWLALAWSLWILIWIERERTQSSTWWIRTYTITGILWYLASLEETLLYLIWWCLILRVWASYVGDFWKLGRTKLTSELSLMMTWVAGVLVGYDYTMLATVAVICLFLLLYNFQELKSFATSLNNDELLGTVKLAIISFIVLPLLPNEAMGPFDAFNPQKIRKIVVFISWISRIGYILSKLLWNKYGIGLTAIVGWLASSTAVTSSLSNLSAKNSWSYLPYTFGVVIASSIMFFRMLAALYVFNQNLFSLLLPSLAWMGIAGFAASGYWARRMSRDQSDRDITVDVWWSPFELKPALFFAIIFSLVGLISNIGLAYLPEQSLYLIAIISWLSDVDAITLTIATLPTISATVAIGATLFAATSNTIVKGVLAWRMGSQPFWHGVAYSFWFMILVWFLIRLIPLILG